MGGAYAAACKVKDSQFHHKHPGAAHHINAAIFDSILFTRADLATSWRSSRVVTPRFEGGVMKGDIRPSPYLLSPLLLSPCSYVFSPHLCTISRGHTPKADDLCIQSLPDVDSLKVVDTLRLPPLVPQRHRTCLGRTRIGLCDTTAPSTVTWKASYGRLGTGRLGTAITSIYFVVRPSQGSLECSLWISPD
jgi:hypothetical protein